MVKINLEISGFYIDDEFPLEKHQHPGVYFVYLGNTTGKKKCTLEELLYIGESENIYQRFKDGHEKYEEWQKESRKKNKKLFFSVAEIKQEDNRKTAEKALIYRHQPPFNDKSKDYFDSKSDTKIVFFGKTNLLDTSFIVYPNKKE